MHRCDEAWKEEPLEDGTESVNGHDWGNNLCSSILQRYRQGKITVLKGREKEVAIIKSETTIVWTKVLAV